MPVAVEMKFQGATIAQYDEVIAAMGLTPGGPGAPGGLFHWVTKTDDGIRVVDVWNSAEEFEQFSKEHIAPAMQQAGVDIAPEVKMSPVHNYFTAG